MIHNPVQIATDSEYEYKIKQELQNQNILAYYSSKINMITTNSIYMVVPISDRMVHRGHAIFDTLNIYNNKAILLDQHMERMENSCKLVEIALPMEKQQIRQILLDIAAFCLANYQLEQNENISLRYWISVGGNTFDIYPPESNQSILYVVALKKEIQFKQVKEFTIDKIQAKQVFLSNSKTTNYMINSLVAKKSKEQGGELGIMLDENGYILEFSIANVIFLWDNDEVHAPKFNKILKGTTCSKVLEFIEKNLIPKQIVKKIVLRDIKPEEVYQHAKEMISLSGDRINIVYEYDGNKIGQGKDYFLAQIIKDFIIQFKDEEGILIDTSIYKMKNNKN